MTESGPIFRCIVAATPRLDLADAPAVTAARLARNEKADLHIVHVVTSARISGRVSWPPQQHPSGRPIAMPSFPMMARRLATLYAKEFPRLSVNKVRIVSGVAWEGIFKSANAVGSQLVVLGPHVEPSISTVIPRDGGGLGSTAEGVIRHARCPVMIINQPFDTQCLRFKKIAVGIDFSRPCVCALFLAAVMAGHFNSRIHPFHMLPIPPYPKYTPESFQVDLGRIKDRLRRLCRTLLNDLDYQTDVVTGTMPHSAMLRYARKIKADAIVIGSHTHEQTGKWYPGSVAQQLSFGAKCPVIVVNGPQALVHWKDDPRVADLASMDIAPLVLFPA